MKKTIIYYSIISVAFFYSCSNTEGPDERQLLVTQIDSMQKKMINPLTMEIDKNLVQSGITFYENFVNKYPDDSLSADYLFRVSDLSRGVGDNAKALDVLKKICKNYPDYKKIPECIFLQGYYLQEFFGDTTGAKAFYQELIAKYPNHAFVDDANALMSMFGKSEADIIKSFEAKEQTEAKK